MKSAGKPPASASSATHDGNANNDKKGGDCALCKKYNTNSPDVWKTHPINDCKKYNKYGTTKPFKFGNSRDIRAHNGKKSVFTTLKKEAKSTKCTVKKMKR